jgi:hypothetical protein
LLNIHNEQPLSQGHQTTPRTDTCNQLAD